MTIQQSRIEFFEAQSNKNQETLLELRAYQAELLAELKRIEEAISMFGDLTPVKIVTHRNLRNTPAVAWYPEGKQNMLIVYADATFTTFADRSDRKGYVPRCEWERFKLAHADLLCDLIQEVKE